MNTNKVEGLAATAVTSGVVATNSLQAVHDWLQIAVVVLNILWWIRLWIKNPKVKPPEEQRYQKPKDWQKIPILMLCAILPAFVLVGCASMVTTITEGGKTTHSRIFTFWDSQSALAKLHTTSTDKTQSITVSGLAQESSASNVVALSESLVRAAIEAALKK
jgi:hypothetical protein